MKAEPPGIFGPVVIFLIVMAIAATLATIRPHMPILGMRSAFTKNDSGGNASAASAAVGANRTPPAASAKK